MIALIFFISTPWPYVFNTALVRILSEHGATVQPCRLQTNKLYTYANPKHPAFADKGNRINDQADHVKLHHGRPAEQTISIDHVQHCLKSKVPILRLGPVWLTRQPLPQNGPPSLPFSSHSGRLCSSCFV